MAKIVLINSAVLTAPPCNRAQSQIINDIGIVSAACIEIYRRWRRYVRHDEALEQAQQFAQRCAELEISKQLSTSELGSVIAAVAEAMAQS